MKSIYDTEVAKVEVQYRQDLLRLPQDHIRDLRELEQTCQRAGDLKALLAVQQERIRFTRDPRVDSIVVAAAPPRLGTLQSQYVKASGDLKVARDSRLKDLAEKYVRRLAQLQRELTIQGAIDDATAVMNEIERMKTVDVLNQSSAPSPSGDGAVTQVGVETLRRVLKGRIGKWNSMTREIVVEYDFVDPAQAEDWKGGAIDGEQTALACAKTIAWLRPQFESVVEIDVDVQFRGTGPGHARFMMGNSLFVDLVNDEAPRCVVFQTSEHNPVLKIEERLKTAIGNRLKLQFGGAQPTLALNFGSPQRLALQTDIRFPLYLGVGLTTSDSAYGEVKVSGVLAPAFVHYVSEQAGR